MDPGSSTLGAQGEEPRAEIEKGGEEDCGNLEPKTAAAAGGLEAQA